MSDQVKCSCCDGTGSVPLGPVYQETLTRFRKLMRSQKFVVANQDHEQFNCKPTALNNRLRGLEKHGFLQSEWYGREHRYSLKTT